MQYSKAEIKELEELADSDPSAAYELGLRYYAGIHIKQDMKKAFALFRSAANAGNVGAMYLRGKCHQEGHGIWKDPQRAVKWYMRAAVRGHRQAMYDLGEAYMNGEGVGKNMEEAVKWYKASAEAGYSLANYKMGELKLHENPEEALEWFIKGGEMHNEDCAYYAGIMLYSKGDYDGSVKFLKIAAEQDNLDACLRLAEMYKYGMGVEKNEELADILLEKIGLN